MTTLQERLRDPSHWCAMRRFTDSGYMGDVDDAPIKAADAIDELVAALESAVSFMVLHRNEASEPTALFQCEEAIRKYKPTP